MRMKTPVQESSALSLEMREREREKNL